MKNAYHNMSIVINVVYHPSCAEGKQLAKEIYSYYCQNISSPETTQAIGIPVFYTYSLKSMLLNNINDHRSRNHFIILLIDDNMICDDEWEDCIRKIIGGGLSEFKNSFVLPVLLTSNGYSYVGNINAVRLFNIKDNKESINELLFCLNESILAQLSNNNRSVRIFISHSKNDGTEIAEKIRNYINSHSKLKTFFDTNDLPFGVDFAKEIKKNIKQALFVVVHTDSYSSREWCQREILYAKYNRIPILVVNALTYYDNRTFPYMGNAPTIKWNGSEKNIRFIIQSLLYEAIRSIYFEEFYNDIKRIYSLTKNVSYFPSWPEILDLNKLNNNENNIVLYPDPPLSDNEVELLQKFSPKTQFTTPVTLPIYINSDYNIQSLKVGMSISNYVDDEEHEVGIEHLNQILIELTRYLIATEQTVCYGGDWRKGGFTEIIANMLMMYNRDNTHKTSKIIHNYSAWPIYLNLKRSDIAKIKPYVKIHKIELPDSIKKQLHVDVDTYIKPDTLPNQLLWANSLTNMRKRMNEDVDVRIAMGGKLNHGSGKYSGILEEILYAVQAKKPVFLIGGFGGITKEIIKLIIGEGSNIISKQYQNCDSDYREFIIYYNKSSALYNNEPIDYDEICRIFDSCGIEGLNNGLSAEENKVLFHSRVIPEIISLILKGIYSISHR